MELLVASNNPGKVNEIKNFLKGISLQVYNLQEWKEHQCLSTAIPDPEENGLTYEENALIKAKASYLWSGIPCLADDTGLEVEALQNGPGLYTARYAGLNASFADNIHKMQRELRGAKNRRAKFKACLVYYDGLQVKTFFGEVAGEILPEQQGIGGFGYDPIFKPEGRKETFAELKSAEPSFPTHRVKALEQFKEFLLASKLRIAQ